MDDFIIILKRKSECIDIMHKIEVFLNKKLKLQLNEKSNYYPYKMGVNFCGYRIFTTHKLLRLNSKKKIKNHVKEWNYLYKHEKLDFKYTLQSLNSWIAHSSHCNSKKLQKKIINSCEFLFTPKTYDKLEQDIIHDSINYKNPDSLFI